MFLKEIESHPPEGMTKIAFNKLRVDGEAIPEILHLFRFKRHSTDHLVRFTEEVMRGPSPLSSGLRELIGAYFSRKNQCSFCCDAHAAARDFAPSESSRRADDSDGCAGHPCAQ